MPKLAANLSTLWAELPYLDRFEAAQAAGFEGVAVPLPYEMPAKETQRAALRSGLPVVHICAPPPNYTGGDRGFAAVPGLEKRFEYDLRRALRYCEALRVPVLHIMAGVASGAAARQTLVANLRHACDAAPDGITLTLEPKAQADAFLSDFEVTAGVIHDVGAPNLGLQFHSQHAAALGGDAVSVFETYADLVRHIQLADTEGAAPGTGATDFGALAEAINRAQYAGWLVADYTVDGRTEEHLDWMALFQT